jgi:orotidine-5'-phosphate decarboxylase
MAKAFSGAMGVVPALDIDSHEQFELVVKSTTKVDGVVGYKLGLTTVLRFGLDESVRRLRDLTDLPILYDHQKAGPDMPDMAKKFTAMCAQAGVDGLILFPVAGPTAVDGFVGEAVKAGIAPVVGGEIPVPDYCASGGGYMLDDALDRILQRSTAAKADHFVLPAHDMAKVKRWSNWIGANVINATVFRCSFEMQTALRYCWSADHAEQRSGRSGPQTVRADAGGDRQIVGLIDGGCGASPSADGIVCRRQFRRT